MSGFDRRLALRWLAALALVTGAACGSVSMSGGISGTSQVFGAISGFGSIIVNGLEFDTTGAEVVIDGDSVPATNLRLGMVTAVQGQVDARLRTGVAEKIVVEFLVQGPVESVEPAAGSLVVVGQTVLTSATTVFDGVDLRTVEAGDTLVVSGFFDAQHRIRASRIELPFGPPEIAVAGTIENLDESRKSFVLGGLVVDYATIVESPPPGALRNGLLVEVDADEPPVDGVLVATGIDVLDSFLTGEEGDALDVQGFVTAIASATEFVVNAARTVRITADTRFKGGNPGDLALNARVDVEGPADSSGALIAVEVEFLPDPTARASGSASTARR